MGKMKDRQIDLMNKPTFTVTKEPATKVIVTISRRQLWNNFIDGWKDIAWDGFVELNMLNEVSDVLLCDKGLNEIADDVRQLFREGITVSLMGSAMKHLDLPRNKNFVREIIVQDINETTGEVQESVVVRHNDIEF